MSHMMNSLQLMMTVPQGSNLNDTMTVENVQMHDLEQVSEKLTVKWRKLPNKTCNLIDQHTHTHTHTVYFLFIIILYIVSSSCCNYLSEFYEMHILPCVC
jgi:hypothetical protein